MQNKEKSCRHEYVKIFQRKYKGLGRRLVSTKGYLPVGFSAKDFTYLGDGSFCFCTGCRLRLYPTRIDSPKLEKIEEPMKNEIQPGEDIPGEDIPADGDSDLQVVNVEELQVESIEVNDIADKKVIVSGEIDPDQEEEEE